MTHQVIACTVLRSNGDKANIITSINHIVEYINGGNSTLRLPIKKLITESVIMKIIVFSQFIKTLTPMYLFSQY